MAVLRIGRFGASPIFRIFFSSVRPRLGGEFAKIAGLGMVWDEFDTGGDWKRPKGRPEPSGKTPKSNNRRSDVALISKLLCAFAASEMVSFVFYFPRQYVCRILGNSDSK